MKQRNPSRPLMSSRSDLSRVAYKVPEDTPYALAKRAQLVDKDPDKAILLFRAAINQGDRADSALKDMAMVMKHQNRAEEAIEAIKSLRHRCSNKAHESLDNILLDLYKRCGRIDDQIALLKCKLRLIYGGHAFNGKPTKTARSQGRKFQLSIKQEATRLLGNLGWALMQENYKEAEQAYRRALLIELNNNNLSNLGICLMRQGRIAEAKEILMQVSSPSKNDLLKPKPLRGSDSHMKAFEGAQEMLHDLEKHNTANWRFDTILGQSSAAIWQPHSCIDVAPQPISVQFVEKVLDENGKLDPLVDLNRLNVDAAQLYSSKMVKKSLNFGSENIPLKRTRFAKDLQGGGGTVVWMERFERRRLGFTRQRCQFNKNQYPELPNADEFDAALVETVLAPLLDVENAGKGGKNGTSVSRMSSTQSSPAMPVGKRLRIFQDITASVNRRG